MGKYGTAPPLARRFHSCLTGQIFPCEKARCCESHLYGQSHLAKPEPKLLHPLPRQRSLVPRHRPLHVLAPRVMHLFTRRKGCTKGKAFKSGLNGEKYDLERGRGGARRNSPRRGQRAGGIGRSGLHTRGQRCQYLAPFCPRPHCNAVPIAVPDHRDYMKHVQRFSGGSE